LFIKFDKLLYIRLQGIFGQVIEVRYKVPPTTAPAMNVSITKGQLAAVINDTIKFGIKSLTRKHPV
jgi:hypothetical protein